MLDISETVQSKLGQLVFSLCEAEAMLRQKDERIAELEAMMAQNQSSVRSAMPERGPVLQERGQEQGRGCARQPDRDAQRDR